MSNDYNDIIVSSRIRLARNLSDEVFPNRIKTERQALNIISRVFAVLNSFNNLRIKDIKPEILLSLQEKHLISADLVENIDYGAISINDDETVCVMINEEEHLREQCVLKGFALTEALDRLNEIDDKLLEELPVAYSEQLGFLTTCPTNLGTGLRASVMLFLPALSITNSINNLVATLNKVGLTVRGMFGEGTDADAFMFQISNSQTLGLTEEQIISNVSSAVLKVCEKEKQAREEILKVNSAVLKDKIFRAYGILTNAYSISSAESLKLLSQVKFGVYLNLISGVNIDAVDRLMVEIMPNTLSIISGRNLTSTERDIFRAEHIKKQLT